MRSTSLFICVAAMGCGSGSFDERLPYAAEVVDFAPGPGAGFGEDRFPEVVLGPPVGSGPLAGGLDVLSLGMGGEIVLGFGECELVDGPGADFVVFENPFWAGGDPESVWAELAEVSVSEDGETWHTFECDASAENTSDWEGCAGWHPTLEYDPTAVIPIDPTKTGGDPFDLAELGVERARYVRIVDLADDDAPPSAGFDLDAVGLVTCDEFH